MDNPMMPPERRAEMLKKGRKAVEDALVEFRDSRISMLNVGNGFVIHEKDGTGSSVIRLSTVDGLGIAFKAMGGDDLLAENDRLREIVVHVTSDHVAQTDCRHCETCADALEIGRDRGPTV